MEIRSRRSARGRGAGYNDTQWQPVDLPHDWSIFGPFDIANNPRSEAALPASVGWYRKMMNIPAEGKAKRPAPKPKAALELPLDLAAALGADATAQAQWDAFSPGKRRDYIEWVLEAKRAETRTRRIETIVAQVAEGKDRNWKYKGC